MASRHNDIPLAASPPPVVPGPTAPNPVAQHTYGQILKSSALIGGSSAVTISIGIVRTKAMAVLLGPAGVGLLGLYSSILDLTLSIAALGINSSGVRQIAEAVGSGDSKHIARTIVVLRRTAVVLGIFGAILLAIFAFQISHLTFGTEDHAGAVALLAFALFFKLVADSQAALVQGLRRIADLAKLAIIGALLGTIVSIALVYAFGEDGIALALAGNAAMLLSASWWYSRKVRIERPALTYTEVRQEAASLIRLGLAFMGSAFLMMGAAYAVRAMVLRAEGVEAAGLYQAAWTLGGLYVGFILQAMGADFYPRLVGVAGDNPQCNRLVNEQAQVSLLLAAPGVLATLTFAPLVIAVFYTAKFAEAVEILRWICLGMALRVITWPMGFIIVAKNSRAIFFGTELAWTVVNVGLSWMLIESFGLNGAGMAFFGSYVFHALMIYPIVRWLSGFRLSAATRKAAWVFIPAITGVFVGFYLLPPLLAAAIGTLATLLTGIYSFRLLITLVPIEHVPGPIRRWLVRFGDAGRGPR